MWSELNGYVELSELGVHVEMLFVQRTFSDKVIRTIMCDAGSWVFSPFSRIIFVLYRAH